MNRKLLRVLDEIDRTEAKIAEWQGHLASLHEQRVQLEEKEIIKGIRAMNLTGRELLAAVDGLCTGKLTLAAVPEPDGDGTGMADGAGVQEVTCACPDAAGSGGNTGQTVHFQDSPDINT